MDLQTRANEIAVEMFETQENYRAMVAKYDSQKLRPPHCIHGVSLWADYDIFCYGCDFEDGFREESTAEEIRALALAEAVKENNQKMYRIHSAAITLNMAIDLSREYPGHFDADTLDKITESVFQQYGI